MAKKLLSLLFFLAVFQIAFATDWPKSSFDLNNTGTTPDDGSTMNNVLWKYTVPGAYYGGSIVAPVVSEGILYFGSSFDNSTYALNATTGTQLWNFTFGGEPRVVPAISGGILYAGAGTYIYAINATTGAKIWNKTAGDLSQLNHPAVSEGLLYFGSISDRKIHAWNATTGDVVWTYLTGDGVWSSPAISDGVLYIGSDDNHTYALNATTGKQKWNFSTDGWVDMSPLVSKGVVYFGSGNWDLENHSFYALNATTGAMIWNYSTNGSMYLSSALYDNIIYFLAARSLNYLYALNATTGALIWYNNESTLSPVVSGNGILYTDISQQYFTAFNAKTGAEIWKYNTGGSVGSGSAAISNGIVYVMGYNHTAYAFFTNDTIAPSAVSGLQYSLTDVVKLQGFWYDGDGVPHYFTPEGTLNLTWSAATDAGSGIAYYKIYKDSVNMFNTSDLNYIERTSLGHEYKVSAVDYAGNEGPNATINITLNAWQPLPTPSLSTAQASRTPSAIATQTIQAQLQPVPQPAPITGRAAAKIAPIKQITRQPVPQPVKPILPKKLTPTTQNPISNPAPQISGSVIKPIKPQPKTGKTKIVKEEAKIMPREEVKEVKPPGGFACSQVEKTIK